MSWWVMVIHSLPKMMKVTNAGFMGVQQVWIVEKFIAWALASSLQR